MNRKRTPLTLTANAKAVLERRYLLKDKDGIPVETPEELFQRVAAHIAGAEAKYGEASEAAVMEEKFYNLMAELKFLPNTPTLINSGRPLGQLSACFVLPVEDSMEKIFDALKNAALIHKSGGGTGFSFSRLRPRNSRVGGTGGVASGPVSFMRIFNRATEEVKQGGVRRGANMGVLRVDHPDIMEFILCKKNNLKLNNFNISVGLTEAFLDAVDKGGDYDLLDPGDRSPVGKKDALLVYRTIVRQAWENGEPGILFLDRINRDNPTPLLGEMESTNPCGEQPLLPMEACNLGSLNLSKFVTLKQGRPAVDYKALKEAVGLAVRFLDNAVDMSVYPLAAIEEMVRGNRKIGLGVMGFADLLFLLNLPYDSDAALSLAEEVMSFIARESRKASLFLGEKRGVFKNHDRSVFHGKKGQGYRNATTTTIARTGTLSIIAGCSSGIEPIFAVSYTRKIMDNDRFFEVNPHFETVARKRGFYSPKLMEYIAGTGSIAGIREIPGDVRRVFVTAHDISPSRHIRMQAAFQKYTDNAVSKTVNLPGRACETDVMEVYDTARRLGVKGVTLYRSGSRENQVLAIDGPLGGSARSGHGTGTDGMESMLGSEALGNREPMNKLREEDETDAAPGRDETTARPDRVREEAFWNKPPTDSSVNRDEGALPGPETEPADYMAAVKKRPTTLEGFTSRVKTGMGYLYVTVTEMDNKPFEVFATIGKSGKSTTAKTEAMGRLISLALRAGVRVEHIVDQIKGIRGEHAVFQNGSLILSIPDAIGKVLEKRYLTGRRRGDGDPLTGNICPDCREKLIHEEGCLSCKGCGFTKCS